MTTFDHVACTVCGCLCDDLRITVEGGRIGRAEGACSLAEPWFLEQGLPSPPVARIDGELATLDDAIERAAELLASADSPLIYGLSRSSTEGQRSAVALAERLGATIDTTASLCHAPSVMAIQEVGEVTCTLGEVKNRADLVIYWGVNPVESHPRHMERYALFPQGRFVPGGRSERTLVVADVKRTATSELADVYLQIEPGKDFEVLVALRNLVLRDDAVVDSSVGASPDMLRQLAERMKTCRYGIVFFGLGLSLTSGGQHNVEALLTLVRDLNRHTRFCARRMRVPGDVTGSEMVLLWQTGYPFSVNFSRGYPRYNPGEFSGEQMIERDEADLCLFVGSEGIRRFPPAALARLAKIPTIVLDHPTVTPPISPTVHITTAVYGIHLAGAAYRMDTVPIRLRAFLPTEYPSDCDVLKSIDTRLAEV